jgi:hypothetical protein
MLGADSAHDLGRAVARLEVALWAEGLRGESAVPAADGLSVLVHVSAAETR